MTLYNKTMIIIGTNDKRFKTWHNQQGSGKNNGAYWYSKEIEDIILPEIKSSLFIVTAGATLLDKKDIPDGAVVVCHDNRTTLKSYKKLLNKEVLWVCSKKSTVKTLKKAGEKAVYIPLSIDTKYVKQFKTKKTKDIAYVGNAWAFKKDYLKSLPDNIVQLSNLPREKLLKQMAKFKHIIAEGRCLMEAQILGCKVEIPKYQNGLESVFVKPLDSREAIPYWEKSLKAHEKTVGKKCIIRSVKTFKDLQDKRIRKPGEVFAVSNKRAKELLNSKLNIAEKL